MAGLVTQTSDSFTYLTEQQTNCVCVAVVVVFLSKGELRQDHRKFPHRVLLVCIFYAGGVRSCFVS